MVTDINRQTKNVDSRLFLPIELLAPTIFIPEFQLSKAS